jgi:hypothetical protein
MKPARYIVATAELLLIFPAALFMSALFVRNWQPLQYEPAHTAQRIVELYSSSTRIGLWVLLIALPLTVLLTGCGTLFRQWNQESQLRQDARQILATLHTHLSTFLVACATVAAGGFLSIVALHVLTD